MRPSGFDDGEAKSRIRFDNAIDVPVVVVPEPLAGIEVAAVNVYSRSLAT